jgi:hypothetical protein
MWGQKGKEKPTSRHALSCDAKDTPVHPWTLTQIPVAIATNDHLIFVYTECRDIAILLSVAATS